MERCRAGADVQMQLTRSPQEEGQNSDSKHRHPEDNGTVKETELHLLLNLQALGFVW